MKEGAQVRPDNRSDRRTPALTCLKLHSASLSHYRNEKTAAGFPDGGFLNRSS
jgi:hypothetical protein